MASTSRACPSPCCASASASSHRTRRCSAARCASTSTPLAPPTATRRCGARSRQSACTRVRWLRLTQRRARTATPAGPIAMGGLEAAAAQAQLGRESRRRQRRLHARRRRRRRSLGTGWMRRSPSSGQTSVRASGSSWCWHASCCTRPRWWCWTKPRRPLTVRSLAAAAASAAASAADQPAGLEQLSSRASHVPRSHNVIVGRRDGPVDAARHPRALCGVDGDHGGAPSAHAGGRVSHPAAV
mmetsp:Transcript_5901/g.21061  ORF Transcript_5901/g.21061 Transcript_5901/m.21061 type:complete len:242 (-) Transcript_5901:445-1170(-)